MRSRDLLLHCVSSLSMVNQKFIRFIVLDNITRFFFFYHHISLWHFDLVEGIKIMSNILSFLIFSGNQDIWCSRTEEIYGVFWPLRRTHEISAPTSERVSRS